jgi:hypothetical protein
MPHQSLPPSDNPLPQALELLCHAYGLSGNPLLVLELHPASRSGVD